MPIAKHDVVSINVHVGTKYKTKYRTTSVIKQDVVNINVNAGTN